ncbi:Arm DNA-binding domain-containing protein [Klebsiella pneumoniae]
MALTDIQIKRAKPQDKPYTLNDGQGLSLLINPDGSKGWRFRFRFAGKARLMSFGSYDLVSLGKVRISTLRNENETFSQLNSITYIGVFLRLVTYSHLP